MAGITLATSFLDARSVAHGAVIGAEDVLNITRTLIHSSADIGASVVV